MFVCFRCCRCCPRCVCAAAVFTEALPPHSNQSTYCPICSQLIMCVCGCVKYMCVVSPAACVLSVSLNYAYKYVSHTHVQTQTQTHTHTHTHTCVATDTHTCIIHNMCVFVCVPHQTECMFAPKSHILGSLVLPTPTPTHLAAQSGRHTRVAVLGDQLACVVHIPVIHLPGVP